MKISTFQINYLFEQEQSKKKTNQVKTLKSDCHPIVVIQSTN